MSQRTSLFVIWKYFCSTNYFECLGAKLHVLLAHLPKGHALARKRVVSRSSISASGKVRKTASIKTAGDFHIEYFRADSQTPLFVSPDGKHLRCKICSSAPIALLKSSIDMHLSGKLHQQKCENHSKLTKQLTVFVFNSHHLSICHTYIYIILCIGKLESHYCRWMRPALARSD